MKKFYTAIAALALTIGMASALTFDWYTNTQITFDGTILNSAVLAAPVTAELIFLGADGVWSFDEDGLVTDEAVSTGSVATSGAPTAKGKAGGTFDKLYRDSFTDGSTVGDGNVFGVLITYTDTDGNVWYNLSSNTFTITGATDDTWNVTEKYFDFSWDYAEATATPTAGGGWWTVPSVPEPVSGGLALAGLALLLKRRRA